MGYNCTFVGACTGPNCVGRDLHILASDVFAAGNSASVIGALAILHLIWRMQASAKEPASSWPLVAALARGDLGYALVGLLWRILYAADALTPADRSADYKGFADRLGLRG